ncbi:hypothetical protein NDU88_003621 [Pleurodeles waltl]|uniref:Uncharacterized protein n=1 Tax=Pleurodeles waltl TaxID=8319 RepID=A0AAV7SGF9_PLEWA|nr:hypothetical protein NDU88_003621 [Pleurodeles waltl]
MQRRNDPKNENWLFLFSDMLFFREKMVNQMTVDGNVYFYHTTRHYSCRSGGREGASCTRKVLENSFCKGRSKPQSPSEDPSTCQAVRFYGLKADHIQRAGREEGRDKN